MFYRMSAFVTGIVLAELALSNLEQPVKREDRVPPRINYQELIPEQKEEVTVKLRTDEKTQYLLEVDFDTFYGSDPTIVNLEFDSENPKLVRKLIGKPGNKIHIVK